MYQIELTKGGKESVSEHLHEIESNPYVVTYLETNKRAVQLSLLGNIGVGAFNPNKNFTPNLNFEKSEFNDLLFNHCEPIAQSMGGHLDLPGLEDIPHRRFLVNSEFQGMKLGSLVYNLHNTIDEKPEIECLPYLSMQNFYLADGMLPSKIHLYDKAKNLCTMKLDSDQKDYLSGFISSQEVRNIISGFRNPSGNRDLAAKFQTPFLLEMLRSDRGFQLKEQTGFQELLQLSRSYMRNRNNLGSHFEAMILPPSIQYPVMQIIQSCGASILR